MKRARMSRRSSRKVFTRTAKRVHPRNAVGPSRGGIRL